MKISDGRELPVLSDEVNFLQPPQSLKNWQDSVVLVWWDSANQVGGYHRIGHEPNYEKGPMIALWSHILGPEGYYRNVDFIPLRNEDRMENGGIGAGETCRYEFLEGEHVWTIQDDKVSAVLRHADFHANVECYPKSSLTEEFANVHTDIPGQLRGELTLGDQRYAIEALSFRDRGWGVRDWDFLLAHRWVAGTLGPDLSFLALSYCGADDTMAAFGWVVRGDTVTYAKHTDIVTYADIDGMVNRGGHVRFELTTGEVLDIECTQVASQPFFCTHHGICSVDTLCEARCGDRVGFCDFESTSNIMAGKRMPGKLMHATLINGYHPL